MAWKKLTFVLIPHSQEKVKQISVQRTFLLSFGIFLIAAICIMIFYIMGFNGKKFQISRTNELNEKNNILTQQLAVFDTALARMSMQTAHLESLNTSIIELSGISEMDLERFDTPGFASKISSNSMLPERVLAVINRIDRESEAFEQNFTALFDECMKNSDFIKHVPSIRPSKGTITKEFGRGEENGSSRSRENLPMIGQKSYMGIDINWEEGTPVIATADGVVEESKNTKEMGQYIIIDHGNGYKTRYAHLQPLKLMKTKIRIKKGDKVVRGQQIGAIGRTGISITAIPSHIMYSVYHHGIPVNPVDYFFAANFSERL